MPTPAPARLAPGRRRLVNEEKDMRAKALAAQLAIDMAEAQRQEAAERAEKCAAALAH